jgi:Ca2+-binding EF-hand superfamily protein
MRAGNGTIDFDEFLRMMSKWQAQRSRSDPEVRSKTEEDEMRQAFRVFDIDGNGLIDEKELLQTMRNLGENLTEKDVKAMIKAADRNGDEKIDYEGKGRSLLEGRL